MRRFTAKHAEHRREFLAFSSPRSRRSRRLTVLAIMSLVLERFLRYVRYDTQSNESSATYPSTATQLVFLRDLAEELRGLGLADASLDEHGYLTATIPATTPRPR